MGYNRDNYIRIREEYSGKNLQAKEAAAARMDELHAKFPDLAALDGTLAATGLKLMREISAGQEDIDRRIEILREENEQLRRDRAALLEYNGYPADYTDVHYQCAKCSDTGFVGIKMCDCMRRDLINAGFESAGIAELMRTHTFESFSLDYYADDPKAYENAKNVLMYCRRYADTFDTAKKSNLLLCGPTGLGKTHISAAIAKVVIERGFDVIYQMTHDVFSDFEYERFGRGYNTGGDGTRRYFECDLLIIDDLGTEVANQFTISTLYHLINTRINKNKSTIISTNLTRDELRKRYADRITSRLFGEFAPLMFFGRDIRAKKLE